MFGISPGFPAYSSAVETQPSLKKSHQVRSGQQVCLGRLAPKTSTARPPMVPCLHALLDPAEGSQSNEVAAGGKKKISELDLPKEAMAFLLERQEIALSREREIGDKRAELERKLGETQVKLEKVRFESQSRATEILRLQGRVNMRGIIEFVEREEGRDNGYPKGATRQMKWQQILQNKKNSELQGCLAERLGWNSINYSARNIRNLYDSLSLNQHPLVSPEESKRIRGYVMPEDIRDQERSALKCLCETFGFDYRVIVAGEEIEQEKRKKVKQKDSSSEEAQDDDMDGEKVKASV